MGKWVTRDPAGLRGGNTYGTRDRTLEDVYTPGTLIFWTHQYRRTPVQRSALINDTLSLVIGWVDGVGVRAICGDMEFEIPRSELNNWAIFARGDEQEND